MCVVRCCLRCFECFCTNTRTQNGVAVAFVREMSGSNFGRFTVCREGFRGFEQSLRKIPACFWLTPWVLPSTCLSPCYPSREDHNRKIRTRKQRRDVGKYSFLNRTSRSWNQLPAGLLAFFPCKLNTFRKRLKNVVTSKGIQVGVEFK